MRSHHKSNGGAHERTHHHMDGSNSNSNSNNLRGAEIPDTKEREGSARYGKPRSGFAHGYDAKASDVNNNQGRTGDGRSEKFNVLIIGAGAAGLSAAHQLDYEGWTYKVLEASDRIGGRTRQDWEFGDEGNEDSYFNIDLGAQYIHTTNNIGNGAPYASGYDILNEMVQGTLSQDYKTTYTKKETEWVYALSKDENGQKKEIQTEYHEPPEYRWAGGMGWHSFLTSEVAYTEVRNNVVKNCKVTNIKVDSDSGFAVKCGTNGPTYLAEAVIVTVPMKMLQAGSITFDPALPSAYTSAFDTFAIGNGFKIWIEYDSNAKYKEYFTHKDDYEMYQKSYNGYIKSKALSEDAGYRLFWNEVYPYTTAPQNTKKIVGGLIYGKPYNDYAGKSPAQIRQMIIDHLAKDGMVEGTPTGEWAIMDWGKEPFFKGAYTIFAEEKKQEDLLEPVVRDGWKLYFAGEALNTYTWGTVHGAAKTGRDQAQKIIDEGRRRE